MRFVIALEKFTRVIFGLIWGRSRVIFLLLIYVDNNWSSWSSYRLITILLFSDETIFFNCAWCRSVVNNGRVIHHRWRWRDSRLGLSLRWVSLMRSFTHNLRHFFLTMIQISKSSNVILDSRNLFCSRNLY